MRSSSSNHYTPSSLSSRYRPTGLLKSSGSAAALSFNYTPSSSSHSNSRLNSIGLDTLSRYSSSTLANPSLLSSTASRDSYLPSVPATTGHYNINQSPYGLPSTSNSSELYSALNGTQQNAYSSRFSPGPSSSRLSPTRMSPTPSTSGLSTQKFARETSPLLSQSSTNPKNPKLKFLSRRSSTAELNVDRRPSLADSIAAIATSEATDNKRSFSLTDPNAVPAVKESWASGYLRRRKEAQKEEEQNAQADKTDVYGLKSKEVKKLSVRSPPPIEHLHAQKEFMTRLMAAHSKVDELLSRRGLKSEDESKFIRHFEWAPAIEEELLKQRSSPRVARRRQQTVSPRQSASSESDSGLSMESATSADNDNHPLEDIEAEDCSFRKESAEVESCKICVLMSGTDTSVSKDIQCLDRSEKQAIEMMLEPMSTKMLVRQKLSVNEEAETMCLKLPKKTEVKAKPKSIKKLVRQKINAENAEVIELKVPKTEKTKAKVVKEDALPQPVHSKSSVAKCKVKILDADVNEMIKLKPVRKNLEDKKPKVKSLDEVTLSQSLLCKHVTIKCRLNHAGERTKEVVKLKPVVKKQEESRSASTTKLITSDLNSSTVEVRILRPENMEVKQENEPIKVNLSKCVVAKCRVKQADKMIEGLVRTDSEDTTSKAAEKAPTQLFKEVSPKMTKGREKLNKKEKLPGKLQPFEFQSKEPTSTPLKVVKKLLKRQQTEPTLTSTQRQVGKLQCGDKTLSIIDTDIQPLFKPPRHLLDSFSMMNIANRTTNARFRAAMDTRKDSMAEISVQHCSFYEVQKAMSEPREKCLRIHLRLTAHSSSTTVGAHKTLPTNERTHRLVHCITECRDILSTVNEGKQEESAKKLPGACKNVKISKSSATSSYRPLIFADTSVQMVKEKLKRQQADAKLQSIRGNLRRVNKARLSSLSKKDDKHDRKSTGLDAQTKKLKLRRKKIEKCAIKDEFNKGNKPAEDQARSSNELNSSLNNEALLTNSSSSLSLALPAGDYTVLPSASSSSIASSQHSARQPASPVMNKKFIRNWERRIIEEFRRNMNIPVLHAVYRQIFCLKCKICPMLGAPRPPARATFIRRHASHHRVHLSDLGTNELLRLMAIFRPSAAQIARLSTKSHRSKQFTSINEGNPFEVRLRRVNRRQGRPWIPHNQRKPKFQFVPKWRHPEIPQRNEEEVEVSDDEETVMTDVPVVEVTSEAKVNASEEEEEEEEEEEVNEVEAVQNTEAAADEDRKSSRRTTIQEEPDPSTMSEAQQAMLAAKKRQEQEQELRAMDADSRRKAELQHIEEELRVLKQRQIERQKEREADEAKEAVRRKEQEAKRKAEEEERRNKMEADKMRRTEEKLKRQQQAGSFAGFGEKGDGRNFTITGKGQKPAEKEKKKTGLTKEQKEEAKRNYISSVNKPTDVANLLPNDIKIKIKQVHQKILRLEGEKYDLEKRHERQEYDLKELFEREKQVARNKAIKAGIDPSEQDNSNLPPKIVIASKFDRQTDRRTYKEKFTLFENPYVRPPLSIVRGSGRPPPEWGRREIEELENIRKNLEPPKYVEQAPVEGDAAKPPVQVVPMQIPTDEFDPNLEQKSTSKDARLFGTEENDSKADRAAPSGGNTDLEIVV